jgi:hypothetical protein
MAQDRSGALDRPAGNVGEAIAMARNWRSPRQGAQTLADIIDSAQEKKLMTGNRISALTHVPPAARAGGDRPVLPASA